MLAVAEITGKLFMTLFFITLIFMAISMLAGIKLREYKRWLQNLFGALVLLDLVLFVTTVILYIWSL